MANYLTKMELIDEKLRQEKYILQAKISEEIQNVKRQELEMLEKDRKKRKFIYFSLFTLSIGNRKGITKESSIRR